MSENTKNEVFKYSATCGLLRRNSIKNKIQTYCFHKDIKYNLIENKGILESTLLYEFNAPENHINELKIFLCGLTNPYKPKFEQSKANWIIKKYGEVLNKPLNKNIFITLSGCRSEDDLNNPLYDIVDAIKQTLLISSDTEFRQALVDGYISLGSFIDKRNYDQLLKLLENYEKLSKDEKKTCENFVKKVEEEIKCTQEQLTQDIFEFQIMNGFI